MNWLQVEIYTTNNGIEPVCGRLYSLGITGLEIEDSSDFEEFMQLNKQAWDYVEEELIQEKQNAETCIKFYVSDNPSGHETLNSVCGSLKDLKLMDTDDELGRLEVKINNINEEDWANNWKQYFHPIPIGEKILIRPEWEELTAETDRIVFTVNPGMNFGTGSHFTTQLCIEELEKYIEAKCNVLDLGCGSGILSIISLLLGADYAVAVDIDPNAENTAYANLARNGISKEKYSVLVGNVLTDNDLCDKIGYEKYDIVVANIVADVIISVCGTAFKQLKVGGTFIASGIIIERLDEVKEAVSNSGFEKMEVRTRGEWAAIVALKP